MYLVNPERCAGCGFCAEACPRGAIQVIGGRARIDPVRCTDCGVCARVCPREAIQSVAPPISVAYPRGRAPAPPLSRQLKELTAQVETLTEEWEQVMERLQRLEGKWR
jgi:ferredoxin